MMNARRTTVLFGLQLAWELARFFGLFLLLLFRFRALLLDDPSAMLWLVALGSTQLLVPSGLLFLILYRGKRAVLLPFVRLAKVLQLFPVLLLLFSLPFGRGLPHLPLRLLPARLSSLPFLLASVLADLICLFFLFGVREADVPCAGSGAPDRFPVE